MNRREAKESYKCKPTQYKRHMDLHIQTLFKYLSDREDRRKQLEDELREMSKRPQCVLPPLRDLLTAKESRYLRSLRSKMSPSDFVEIEKLGHGYMGIVYLVRKRSSNGEGSNLFAMKKIKKSQVYEQNHKAHVMAERDILAEADNEWIVKLYYSFQDEKFLYFILEYLPGGDMIRWLQLKGCFTEEEARFYIAEISLAVQFVHDMGYIHRDIKPDNILIDAYGHIKLTDFGLCTGFRWTHDSKYWNDDTLGATINSGSAGDNCPDEHLTITRALTRREIEHSLKPKNLSLVGSPNYIAPEVLRQAHITPQPCTNEKLCDWWSVGVILFEMVVGHCPFIDIENLDWNNSSQSIQDRIMSWKKYLKIPNDRQLSDEVIDLIKGLICDPEDRLCQNGISDIQSHPFFKGIDWKSIRSKKAPFEPKLKNELDTSHFESEAPFPEQTFDSSVPHNEMDHFTYKNFWNRQN